MYWVLLGVIAFIVIHLHRSVSRLRIELRATKEVLASINVEIATLKSAPVEDMAQSVEPDAGGAVASPPTIAAAHRSAHQSAGLSVPDKPAPDRPQQTLQPHQKKSPQRFEETKTKTAKPVESGDTEDPVAGAGELLAARSGLDEPGEIVSKAADLYWWVRQWFENVNTIVVTGVVILLFGVGFLLKYLSAKGIISFTPLMGVVLVAMLGLGLVYFGALNRTRKAGYASALIGAGAGTLFLDAFAAGSMFELIGPTVSFVLLAAVGIGCALYALRENSQILMLLGLLGGYLAPILIDTPDPSHFGLLAYLIGLNLLGLWVIWLRPWTSVAAMGSQLTLLIAGFWGFSYFDQTKLILTEFFAVFFLAIQIAMLFAFVLRHGSEDEDTAAIGGYARYVGAGLLFGIPIEVFGFQAAILESIGWDTSLGAMAIAVIYGVLALAIWRHSHPGLKILKLGLLHIAISGMALALAIYLDGASRAIAWALQGLGVTVLGLHQRSDSLRWSGLVVLAAAPLAMVLGIATKGFGAYDSLAYGIMGAAFVAVALRLWIAGAELADHAFACAVAGLAIWYGGNCFEISRLVPADWDLVAGLVFVAASSFVLSFILPHGKSGKRDLVGRLPAWLMLPAAFLGLSADVLRHGALFFSESHPFIIWTTAAFLFFFGTIYWMTGKRRKTAEGWPFEEKVHAGLSLAIFFVAAVHILVAPIPPKFTYAAAVVFSAIFALLFDHLKRNVPRFAGWEPFAYPGYAFPYVLLGLICLSPSSRQLFAGQGHFVATAIGATAVAILFYNRPTETPEQNSSVQKHIVVGSVLALWGLTWQAFARLPDRLPLENLELVSVIWPAMAVLALFLWRKSWLHWPLRQYGDAFKRQMVPLLFIMAGIWTAATPLLILPDAIEFQPLPILNLLDITQLLLFWIVWRFIATAREDNYGGIFASARTKSLEVFAVGVFYWMNMFIIRLFQVPDAPVGPLHELLGDPVLQMTFTLYWTLAAGGLMIFASRFGNRRHWFVGATLLGIVVLKLFTSDMADTGTLTRIISFMGVGVLIVIFGYYFSAPAKRSSDEGAEQPGEGEFARGA